MDARYTLLKHGRDKAYAFRPTLETMQISIVVRRANILIFWPMAFWEIFTGSFTLERESVAKEGNSCSKSKHENSTTFLSEAVQDLFLDHSCCSRMCIFIETNNNSCRLFT